jgi:hypothetical protein
MGEKEVFVPLYEYKLLQDKLWDKDVDILSLRDKVKTLTMAYNRLNNEFKEEHHG